MGLQQRVSNNNGTPTRSPNPLDNPNARQVSIRKFPKTGEKSDAILYRADHDGSITSYATYDNKGMIVKRVDMKGKAHNDITTPHVVEWGRNTKASDGVKRVTSPRENPRKPRPNELQY